MTNTIIQAALFGLGGLHPTEADLCRARVGHPRSVLVSMPPPLRKWERDYYDLMTSPTAGNFVVEAANSGMEQ